MKADSIGFIHTFASQSRVDSDLDLRMGDSDLKYSPAHPEGSGHSV